MDNLKTLMERNHLCLFRISPSSLVFYDTKIMDKRVLFSRKDNYHTLIAFLYRGSLGLNNEGLSTRELRELSGDLEAFFRQAVVSEERKPN